MTRAIYKFELHSIWVLPMHRMIPLACAMENERMANNFVEGISHTVR